MSIGRTMRFLKKLFGFKVAEGQPQAASSFATGNADIRAELEDTAQDHAPVDCYVKWANQYGVLVAYNGIETYVGRRYLALEPEEDHRDMVGKTLKFAVRTDSRRGKLLFTRQPIAAAEKRVAIRRKLENIAMGEEVSGEVIELRRMKAIVRLDEYPEAKAVINRASLRRRFVANMADEFAVGDEVDAIVTGTQPGRATIYICPMEHVQDPWDNIAEYLMVGQIVDGTITTCTKYGVFVELMPGITGLVRVHDLNWNKVDSATFGKKGDPIRVKVMDIDVENRKIALSRKHTMQDPRKDFAVSHKAGDQIEGIVANITDFGMFIEVEDGVQGLLHVNELDLEPDSDHKAVMNAKHPAGSKIRVRVLSIENEGARIGLAPV